MAEIFEGKATTRSRMLRVGSGLVTPGLLWLAVFLFVPIAGLCALAFSLRGDYGSIEWTFSLDNLWRLLGKGLFGWTADNWEILGRSLLLATVTTVLCLLIGFPMALWIAVRPKRQRGLLMAAIMVPSCTNLVIRTYAWMVVLGVHMPFAWAARSLGLIAVDDALYPGALAVYLGMVSSMLPFAVLPLYTSLEKLDWSLVEAARDLYAGPFATFVHGMLSQVMPGVVAATLLTLVPSLGMFVVSDMLGGSRYILVGNLMQQQFGAASDWPFGAMVGLFLVVLSLASLLILQRWGRGAILGEGRS